jgi:spore coat protein A
MLAPAERADLLVDFSLHAGQTFLLWNDAPAPFPMGLVDPATQPVMLIRVKNTTPQKPRALPRLPRIERLNPRDAVVTRHITLNEDFDAYGRLIQRLGTLAGPMGYMDPITETPRIGDVEIWRLINLTGDAHPIHLHVTDYQVLARREFDMATFLATKKLVYTTPSMAPEANETGWKETIKAYPGSQVDMITGNQITGCITDIIVQFKAPLAWAYPQGKYMFHCHILEHEEHDMMRQFYLRT